MSKTVLSDKIIKEIKGGQVKMKPRFYFILRTAAFVLALLFSSLVIIFLVSFVLFVLRGKGAWFLFSFGWPGIKLFLISFPWVLVLAVGVFLVILELLVRQFGFAYRRPLIYSLLGLLSIGLVAGIFVAKTSLHDAVYRSALESTMPVAGALYRNYGLAPLENLYSGVVAEPIDEDNFSIETPEGQNLKIRISTSTPFGQAIMRQKIERNDSVMIMGDKNGGEIRAFGVRKFEKNKEPLFQRWQMERLKKFKDDKDEND